MFDWKLLAELAKELAAETDEAARRSALSRVYYAVFNVARDSLAKKKILVSPDQKVHDKVWTVYEQGDKTDKKIGQYGRQLFRFRLNADYENPYPANLSQNVGQALRMADITLKDLSE